MVIKNKKWKNITLLMTCFTLFIFLVEIFPRLGDSLALYAQLYEQESKIEQASATDTKLVSAQTENKTLKKEISEIVSDYEETQRISSVIKMVDELALKSKIDVNLIKPGKIKQRENLWLQPIDITLSGSFENYYNFIKYLENSDKVVIIKEEELKPEKLLEGKLEIKLKIEVYLNL